MDVERYLRGLDRVSAPPGFEQAVLTRLAERRKARVRWRRLEFSLAGAAALVLAAIIIFSPMARKSPVSTMASVNQEERPGQVVHVVEPLDLRREMRRTSDDSQTVFILEQVSDNMIQQISY
ncbi:MAG: hypothetical protein OP8BY_0453 [Candidatus Saccharicenans subterraneus]|uniref:Uncharacterized protein n=1 Tax=Candidatus Saccharicenans subterraneus TaxID=2508984 RepID=A0A3E2BKX8_9BACT|nr:MAG: hypothetical protein OP8BY_0453 [Candidatus Saccharicenans subterraneum]